MKNFRNGLVKVLDFLLSPVPFGVAAGGAMVAVSIMGVSEYYTITKMIEEEKWSDAKDAKRLVNAINEMLNETDIKQEVQLYVTCDEGDIQYDLLLLPKGD